MHPKLLLIALSCNVMRFEVRFHLTERLKFHITHNYPRNKEKPSLPRVAARGVVFFLSSSFSTFLDIECTFLCDFMGSCEYRRSKELKNSARFRFTPVSGKFFLTKLWRSRNPTAHYIGFYVGPGARGAEGRPSPGRTPRRKNPEIFDFFQKS